MNDDHETVVGTSGVTCPKCKAVNPTAAARCQKCNAALEPEVGTLTATEGVAAGWSVPQPTPAGGASGSLASLRPGTILGGRYEIIELLGEGGMGAVYKAQDRTLERLVAVKVIRPELAGQEQILKRFKQELILARKVSHKNVIRIFDLGEAEGMKYITMEYVEGEDLKHVLRAKSKLSPEESAGIIQQVCRALDAAHSEGVIHRDLKPQNIMIDEQGKIVVMDFGIARSMEMSGITRTGALIGTPEYMSPEQARGEKLDQRSDLFTLGIIFYELLTGKSPYKSETAMGTLLKRMREPAVPPIEVETTIPKVVSDIVSKCLERESADRYQTALEMLADLEMWSGPPPGTVIAAPAAKLVAAARHWKWAAAGLAVLLMVLGGLFLFQQRSARKQPAAKQKVVTLLVADFNNKTGDSVFDGTLEPMFVVAMEGASFVTSFNRGTARRLAGQVRAGATKLDEDVAQLVAVREGINVVVAGSIDRQGGDYTVSVKAIDAAKGTPIVTRETKVSSKEAVLTAVGKLAAPVRKALGDTTPESAQLAAAETFTAASVEAAHAYAVAQDLQLAGKWAGASREYSRSIDLDPNLGRAFSGLAVVSYNLGQRQECEKYYQLALKKIDRMSERERYRTRGGYYVMNRNYEKAIEEYNTLLKQFPADSAGHANLAVAYLNLRNLPKAIEEGRQATEIYPKNVAQRNNVALFTLYSGDFEGATREAQEVLKLNASFEKAYVALALSELGQGRPAQAAGIYQRLEKVSPAGASFASMGLADIALYEGRPADALAILDKGIEQDLAAKRVSPAAYKMTALAQARLALGEKAAAIAAADRALAAAKDESVTLPAALVYIEAGADAKAKALASALAARLEPEVQAYAKLIEGAELMKRNTMRQAIQSLQQANKLADTWMGHLYLGRAYLESEAYAEAHSEFELCLKRRGEATAVFFDEISSYRLLPPVHYYLGRAQDGLGSDGGAASYRAYLAIKEKADKDPLREDARRRLEGR